MFPLRDNIPHLHRPVLTFALILFNLLIFSWELSFSPETLHGMMYYLGLVPARYSEPIWSDMMGIPRMGIFPFLTNIFLHGGWLHIISNMWMLWIFGSNVEDRMGKTKFLLFYIACGVLASFAHFASDPGSAIPVIGASGAIAGVMGAYFRMFPGARIHTMFPVFFFPLFFEVPAIFFLGIWFVTQVMNGAASLVTADGLGGIAFWAHVGGFVAGFLIFPIFLSRKRVKAAELALSMSQADLRLREVLTQSR